MKKALSLLLLMVFCIPFMPTPRTYAATFTVNDEASLVAAIQAANATPEPDTITLANDINLNTTTPFVADGNNGLPSIIHPLIVLGQGFTLRRTSATQFRIFHVAPGSELWIDNITLAGGYAQTGGAIHVDSGFVPTFKIGKLTVTRSIIGGDLANGNTSILEGGGIYGDWAIITIVDSVVSHNTVDGTNGFGGGIRSRDGQLALISSQVEFNVIKGTNAGVGGGVFAGIPGFGSPRYRLIITDSIISNNLIEASGGMGGGMYAGGVQAYIRSSSISSNRIIASNRNADGGGVAFRSSGTIDVVNSEFRDNLAQGINRSEGGGVYITSTNNLNIVDSQIIGNIARSGQTTINASSSFGAGIFSYGVNLSINKSTISNNILELRYFNISGSCCGGGIYAGQLQMTNSTVSQNEIRNTAPIPWAVDGGGINVSSGIITNSTIINNRINQTGVGGGIYSNHTVTFANNLLSNNIIGGGHSPDCYTSWFLGITSQGYNMVSDNTGCNFNAPTDITGISTTLGSLANNGGPTQTHTISDTPPINSGNPATPGSSTYACPTTDQRGAPRGADQCDIGAVEMGAIPPAVYNNDPIGTEDGVYTVLPNTPLTVTAAGVLSNDSDVENEQLFAYPVIPPTNGFVTLNEDGSFNYIPHTNFTGTDEFYYVSCDIRGACQGNTRVQINVQPDNPPFVAGVNPVNGATNVVPSTLIQADFSESVTLGTSPFDLTCTTSGAGLSFNLIGTGATYTLDPDVDFVAGETCTLTIFGAQVADQDGVIDTMTADFVMTFTIAAAGIPPSGTGSSQPQTANEIAQFIPVTQPIASDFIIKTVDKSLAQIGETVTYTITFGNPTDKPIQNATIRDRFDPRLEALTLVSTTTGTTTWDGNNLTVSGIALTPGQQVQLILTARISDQAKAGDVIPNIATMSYNPTYTSNNAPVTILPNNLPATGEKNEFPLDWLLGGLILMSAGAYLIAKIRGQSNNLPS